MVSYSKIIIVLIALQINVIQDNVIMMTAHETMQISLYY